VIFLVIAILLAMLLFGSYLLLRAKPLSIRYATWNPGVLRVMISIFGAALVLVSVRALVLIFSALARR
jgi:hypothetical protein